MQYVPPNPMLIDHILDNIFRNNCLSYSDFLNFRHVCWEWDRAATDQMWFRRSVLKLVEESDSKMERAIPLIKSPHGNFPIPKRIDFTHAFFPQYDDNGEFQVIFGEFLSLVSTQIESLRLQTCRSCFFRFDPKCYAGLSCFRRLKFLEIYFDRQRHPGDKNYCLFLAEKVLQKSPCLWSLSIFWAPYDEGICHEKSKHDFGDILLRSIPKFLQSLKITALLSAYDAEVLSSIHLPYLVSLSLELDCIQVSANDLFAIFSNCKNETLEHLYLSVRTENETIEDFKLPIFPKLTMLFFKLSHEISSANADLVFTEIFPKVSNIYSKLVDISEPVLRTLFPLGFAAPEVTSCCLDMNFELVDIENYAQGFFNLRTLVLGRGCAEYLKPISLVSLPIIFKWCTLLEELEINFNPFRKLMNINSFFTGFTEQAFEEMRMIKANFWDWSSGEALAFKTNPGLADLRRLKTLEITARDPSTTYISDPTGYFGFLVCPNLEKLTLDKFQMSDQLIDDLKLRFGVNNVVIRRKKKQRINELAVYNKQQIAI